MSLVQRTIQVLLDLIENVEEVTTVIPVCVEMRGSVGQSIIYPVLPTPVK